MLLKQVLLRIIFLQPRMGFNLATPTTLSLNLNCPSFDLSETIDKTSAASVLLLAMLGRLGTLGNKCLTLFTKQTGLILTVIEESARSCRTKIVLGRGYQAKQNAFVFSPSYTKVRGWALGKVK